MAKVEPGAVSLTCEFFGHFDLCTQVQGLSTITTDEHHWWN